MEVEQPDWLQQIEGVLESLNEGVLISDDCQNIIFVNSNLEQMTGLPRGEILGPDIHRLYNKTEADFIIKKREQGLQAGKNEGRNQVTPRARDKARPVRACRQRKA